MDEVVFIILASGIVLILLVLVIGILVIAAVKGLRGPGRRGQELDAGETRLIQEIHNGLAKMERRVETLETLLMDQPKKGAEK